MGTKDESFYPKKPYEYGAGDEMDAKFRNFPGDPRDNGGMQYPHYNIIRVPSGSNICLDDTKEHESITIQHAVGSAIQFLPDGAVVYRSEKNSYELVLGHKEVVVTGHVNVIVNGQCDVRVEGDYNLVVHGTMRTTVRGQMETVIYGDETKHVHGCKETTIAGTYTTLSKGTYELISMDRMYLMSIYACKLQSHYKHVFLQSGEDIRTYSSGNTVFEAVKNSNVRAGKEILLTSEDNFHMNSNSKIVMSSTQKATIKSRNYVALDGKKVFFNANLSDSADLADYAASANEN